MKNEDSLIREYIKSKLYKNQELKPFIKQSSIVRTDREVGLASDIMVFLTSRIFSEFVSQYGDSFVIDDHSCTPWIFVRVKSFDWLRYDFEKRISTAIWIYRNSLVLQDKRGEFKKIFRKYERIFTRKIFDILKEKYLEFRTERHSLRYALGRENKIAISLVKNTIIKLGFEISFLVEKKPYPYKKWLPIVFQYETAKGKELFQLAKDFLASDDPELTIKLSDRLVEMIGRMVFKTGRFSEEFVQKWWLHLT